MQILSSYSDWNKQSNFLLISCTSQTEGLKSWWVNLLFIWLFLQKTSPQPSVKSMFYCYFAAFPVEANKSVWLFGILTRSCEITCGWRCFVTKWQTDAARLFSYSVGSQTSFRGWRNSPVLPNIRRRSCWDTIWIIFLNVLLIVASLHFKSSFLS